ncbi:MAG: hypothetical protein J7494_00735 [Sphingobium sp.]|nr:hypothetical protein [Sphingobium sp.]
MISRRASLTLAVLLVWSAAGADAQRRFELQGGPNSGAIIPDADPSAVVAAEIAFARLSREKGQWTGFKATADKDAIMFLPQAANAQAFLKKLKDPPKSVAWQPGRVFISCDGTYAISTGPWQRPNGTTGTFITLWRQQQDGGYKWAFDFGSNKAFSGNPEDGVEAKVADCPARGMRPGQRVEGERGTDQAGGQYRAMPRKRPKLQIVRIPIPAPADGEGKSQDGSLSWAWTSGPKARSLTVKMRYEGAEKTVIDEHVEESS